MFVFAGRLCGFNKPKLSSPPHDPWTAGCFQSPIRNALTVHVSSSPPPLPEINKPCAIC